MVMGKREVVEFSQEERQHLEQLINKRKVAGYKIKHAHMLLKADEGRTDPRARGRIPGLPKPIMSAKAPFEIGEND